MARNYKEEYRKFQSSPTQKRNRASRNRARRRALKNGRVHKGDGKDLHHHKGINSDSVVVMSASKNRGVREKSRLKGSKRRG
jgi:hypothetical protein